MSKLLASKRQILTELVKRVKAIADGVEAVAEGLKS